jgi:hypothetical protein
MTGSDLLKGLGCLIEYTKTLKFCAICNKENNNKSLENHEPYSVWETKDYFFKVNCSIEQTKKDHVLDTFTGSVRCIKICPECFNTHIVQHIETLINKNETK